MKKVLLICAVSMTFFGCKKTETPAATATTANNNFSCKVDGVVYNSASTANLDGTLSAGQFTISAIDAANKLRLIMIRMSSSTIDVKTFPVSEHPDGTNVTGYFTDTSKGLEYDSDDKHTATDKVTITKLDKTAQTISGTFNFTLVDGSDETKKGVFTEGTFTNVKW